MVSVDDRSSKRMKPDEAPGGEGPPPGHPPPPPPYGYPPHMYGARPPMFHGGPPPPHAMPPHGPPHGAPPPPHMADPYFHQRGGWPANGPTRPAYYPQTFRRGGDDMDEQASTTSSNKESKRGSYRCGKCGVPKKGHICPYQPVKKKQEDVPTRCAAIQVEMDEFMTIRRLNLEIQGFPESYASEPYDRVGASVYYPGPPSEDKKEDDVRDTAEVEGMDKAAV